MPLRRGAQSLIQVWWHWWEQNGDILDKPGYFKNLIMEHNANLSTGNIKKIQ